MIFISYSKDEKGLWGFHIRRNGKTEVWTEHIYPTKYRMMKELKKERKRIMLINKD